MTGLQVHLHLVKLQNCYKDTFEAFFSPKNWHCNWCAQCTCMHSHQKCRPLQRACTPYWQLGAFPENLWCFDWELRRVLSFPAFSDKWSTVAGLQMNHSGFSFIVYSHQSLLGFLSWSYSRALQWDHLLSSACDWRIVSRVLPWSDFPSSLFWGSEPCDIKLDTWYDCMAIKQQGVTIDHQYHRSMCQTISSVLSLEVGRLLVRQHVLKKGRHRRGRRIHYIIVSSNCCNTPWASPSCWMLGGIAPSQSTKYEDWARQIKRREIEQIE